MLFVVAVLAVAAFSLRRDSIAAGLSAHPIIVLIAFDGFRPEYLRRGITPTFENFAANGTTAEYMLNQFPTVTSPNFQSINTGMYPETHGVLGNECFDENSRRRHCLRNENDLFRYNDDIIPIWNLNELSGSNRYSGLVEWCGGDHYRGVDATHRLFTGGRSDWKLRVDTVVQWIRNETHPANLVLLYFGEPDQTGHQTGVDSIEMDRTLCEVDKIFDYYLRRLHEYGLYDTVNTIVLSDHGMVTLNTNDVLNLNDYVDSATYTKCGESPVFEIQPNEGFEDIVYQNLSAGARNTNKFAVYKKEDIPDAYRMKNTRRLGDLLVVCDLHYTFSDGPHLAKGWHGYDNNLPEMRAIFMAQGPLFKERHVTRPFQNIDIYPLIQRLLRLNSPPQHVTPNGTLANIIDIVKNP